MDASNTTAEIGNGTRTETESSIDPERWIKLDESVVFILLQSFALVLACTGVFCNFCVIKSLVTVPSKQLKSKYFILNTLFADCLLPFFSSLDIIAPIMYAFKIRGHYVHNCIDILYTIGTPVAMYYQSLASLVLACDRLYAIVAPLRYYTVGYPRWLLLCTIASSWLIPIALILPTFILPFVTALTVPGPGICYKLVAGFRVWTSKVRFFVVIGVGMITFCIYIILFLLVKRMRRKGMALTQTRTNNTNSSVSLAITYFMVHLSSLALFIPGPVFAFLINLKLIKLGLDRSTQRTIRRVLILLYMVNPILDPIILFLRVPAIKESLNLMLRPKLTSLQHSKRNDEP